MPNTAALKLLKSIWVCFLVTLPLRKGKITQTATKRYRVCVGEEPAPLEWMSAEGIARFNPGHNKNVRRGHRNQRPPKDLQNADGKDRRGAAGRLSARGIRHDFRPDRAKRRGKNLSGQ